MIAAASGLLLAAACPPPAGAVTLFGGGTVTPTTDEPAPLYLIAVDHRRAGIIARAGGPCTNGRTGFGDFQTHRFPLRAQGRFHISGSFTSGVSGGVAKATYRIRGRVRARDGVVTGTASVRVTFPDLTAPGRTIVCAGNRRAFRARNPAVPSANPRSSAFYGVTSQGLPMLLRVTPDGTAVVPLRFQTTLACNALGPVDVSAQLRVPATAPGVFATATSVTESFRPAIGSPVTIPAGTYGFDPLTIQAQVAGGRAIGTIAASSRVGNAQHRLIDTCAAPPVAFSAVP